MRAGPVPVCSVLVSVASRHGGTAEIAEALARRLQAEGLSVDLVEPDDVVALDGYDAVVLGSGVYTGHWLAAARHAARRLSAELTVRPVWLLSSGPVGRPQVPAGDAVDIDDVLAWSGAREHRVLPGRLERERLGLAERALVRALHAPEGDFRDWDAVDAWACAIARELTGPDAVGLPAPGT